MTGRLTAGDRHRTRCAGELGDKAMITTGRRRAVAAVSGLFLLVAAACGPPRRARPRRRPASPARSHRAARSRATPPAGPRARRGREAGGQQPVQPDAGPGDRARSGPGLRPPGHRFLHRDDRRDHPVDGLQVGHRHRHRAGPGGDGVVVAPGRRRRLHHQPRHLRAGPPDRRRRPARTVPRVDRADAGPHAVLPRLHRHRRGVVGLQHGHRVRGLALVLRGQGDLAQHRGAGPAVRGR